MPEMTPLEAAKKLDEIIEHEKWLDCESPNIEPLRITASHLRKIANGEYKQVVHARWIEVDDGVLIGNGKHLECSNCHIWSSNIYRYCRCCGAVMDEKEDSHETD